MRKKLLSSALALTVLSVAMVGCKGNTPSGNVSTTDLSGYIDSGLVVGYEEDSSEWFQKVRAYYLEKQPEDRSSEQVYIEGIPGNGSFFTSDSGQVTCLYDDDSGRFRYTFNIMTADNSMDVSIDLSYPDETRFYIACQDVYSKDGLEEITTTATTGNWSVYDDSALATHGDDVAKDVMIMYSRFVTFAKEAFKDAEVSLEDYGIDFGTAYLSVDPKTPHSQEVTIVNEHVFENKVCKDCGESWFKYVYDTIGLIDHCTDDEWHSIYGPNSQYQVGQGDYTQFSSYGENLSIYYYNFDERMDMSINLYQDNEYYTDDMDVSFGIASDYVSVPNKVGIVRPKIEYTLYIDCKPSELSEVLASKESILEHCGFGVMVYDQENDEIESAYDEYDSEDDINALIEKANDLKLTKEEVVDKFYANKDSFIKCFSIGLESFGTNFEDAGLPGLE